MFVFLGFVFILGIVSAFCVEQTQPDFVGRSLDEMQRTFAQRGTRSPLREGVDLYIFHIQSDAPPDPAMHIKGWEVEVAGGKVISQRPVFGTESPQWKRTGPAHHSMSLVVVAEDGPEFRKVFVAAQPEKRFFFPEPMPIVSAAIRQIDVKEGMPDGKLACVIEFEPEKKLDIRAFTEKAKGKLVMLIIDSEQLCVCLMLHAIDSNVFQCQANSTPELRAELTKLNIAPHR